MKAQPYRLATICLDTGIISNGQYDRVMKSVMPKEHAGKSMTDILKSDISKTTLLELAFFDVAKPFKRNADESSNDDGQVTIQTSSTVNLQPAEIYHILKSTETEVESFKAIISEYEPELSEDVQQQLAKAKGHDSSAFFQSLIQRRIVTPNSLLKIVNDQKHPFFEVNRINLLRQMFELNEVLAISDFNNAYEKAINEGIFFSKAAAKVNKFSESRFIEALGKPLDLPSVDLDSAEIDERIPRVFPNECVRREIFMVFEFNPSHLKVAVTDPLDFGLADMLSVLTCRPVYLYGASEKEIIRKINKVYVDPTPLEKIELDEEVRQSATTESKVEAVEFTDPEEVAVDSMSTVQLVTTILENALQDEATDIHMEPQLEHLRIRYRIDGTLHAITTIPKNMMAPILSRVKVLSNLDVTERRRPQDGNFSMEIHGSNVDFRVSTLPTNLGEKIVIRALSEQSVVEGLGELGLDDAQQELIHRFIQRTYGCILATGPTGSGKTTTLYTALNLLNSEDRNLVTIEDPVEYQIPGINQVPVNLKVGVSFASGLRSILRQDPDVIMVGEIRDPETAQVCTRAALTGHLVFSTMHTNTSVGAISSLVNMGVANYLIASSVAGIISQRLVRRICEECTEKIKPQAELLRELEIDAKDYKNLFNGKGCEDCWETGYHGRIGVYEVLQVDSDIRLLINERASETDIMKVAVENGMLSLRQNALNKMREGYTTGEEILKTILMNN